ncbi:hypothetical protein RhiirA4_468026 [Rhizophagus irregularis]|uniref:Uncharacterized protein n=1 Tax=Rhizophagus irregularis TaxID=588596 RepID=A0A2I1GX05_9GLOM|nr:hypothetical protein RhiirA4_468026 [Rhizophagus irregularis]
MKHKIFFKNSTYEESDNNSSNFSTDIKTSSDKRSPLKILKEQASKDNEVIQHKKQNSKKQKKFKAAVEQLNEKTGQSLLLSESEQPIPKHKGYNYYYIPKLFHIKKRVWNGYIVKYLIFAMRHICKEHLSEIANTTIYKDIDAELLNKIINKVKGCDIYYVIF